MFLFISTSSPTLSALSIIFFILSIVFSTAGVPTWLHPFVHAFSNAPYYPHLQTIVLPFVAVFAMLFLRVNDEQAGGGPTRRPEFSAKQLANLVHQLPIERWLCAESRASLSVAELRTRLHARRVSLHGIVEKQELVDALDSVPHETMCSICHEDLSDDDELRLLPCNHYFHVGAFMQSRAHETAREICSPNLPILAMRECKSLTDAPSYSPPLCAPQNAWIAGSSTTLDCPPALCATRSSIPPACTLRANTTQLDLDRWGDTLRPSSDGSARGQRAAASSQSTDHA